MTTFWIRIGAAPFEWTQVGASGLVAMAVVFIYVGILVPRWVVKEKDKLIEKLQIALDRRDEQFGVLIKQTELIVHLLEDLKRAGNEASRMGKT